MNPDGEEILYDAWLSSACMPASMIRKVYDRYESAECFYKSHQRNHAEGSDLISPRFLRLLEQNGSEAFFSQMQFKLRKHRIGLIRFHDSLYPEELAEIEDPPALLFYQGDMTCLRGKRIAMVGSRSASYAGRQATEKLAEELSRQGVTLISGLASGIDTAAHRGCMKGGSPTIAVTGTGLDLVYPAENQRLRDDILNADGLLLSEYPPGTRPLGWHFPIRNRIIAGLSFALVLMEARIRSGSMTSVQHALNQGKDVFVYPGNPSSDYFEGNHQLLREGGIYFTRAEDILNDLGWLDNPSPVGQNSDYAKETRSASPEEEAVMKALLPGMLSFEQLLEVTRLDTPVLMSTLTLLQISGRIEAFPGKYYQIRH